MIKFGIFSALILLTSFAYSDDIDWNNSELEWHSYEQGMKKIKEGQSKGLLIFYADWCSTCKLYSKLFKKRKVVKSLKNLVLIRVNREENPELSEKYDFDGVYIPRTFALNSQGDVVGGLYDKSDQYAYFLPPDDSGYLIDFVDTLISLEDM